MADTPSDRNCTAGPDGPADPSAAASTPLGRRAFLGIVGVGLTSLAWGGAALDLFGNATKAVPESVRGAVPFGQGWRIYAVNPPFPIFDRATWRLTIDGLVEQPVTLTYDDLLALPQTKQVSDFYCVTGWSVEDVRWAGVRLTDLLALAKPLPAATGLRFVSMEKPYDTTLTLDQASLPDVMLAHSMDDAPLTREHGAPTRVVMPKMYGYKGAKWMERITVVKTIRDGYWEARGYDRDAWVGDSNGR
ncbi:MAG: molybdopterin-dependent oxidoreductase [Solirubrobacteraceae bacterium]|nr:molybdopterin-dependent oxidoreductase [Solirubrobacteraceae bacterium]